MERDQIRLKILGEQARISPELRRLIAKTDEISAHYDGFQANVCINYGGRDEIVRAAKKLCGRCAWKDAITARRADGGVFSQGYSIPPVSPTPSSSSVLRVRSAHRTSCSGSRRTRNITLRTCSGRTLTKRSSRRRLLSYQKQKPPVWRCRNETETYLWPPSAFRRCWSFCWRCPRSRRPSSYAS